MQTSPCTFGPPQWRCLHLYADRVDEEYEASRKNLIGTFKKYVESTGELLTCGTCRGHFKENIKLLPVPDDPVDVFRWSWKFHNAVNVSSGTRELTFEEAREAHDAYVDNENVAEASHIQRVKDLAVIRDLRRRLGDPVTLLAMRGDVAVWTVNDGIQWGSVDDISECNRLEVNGVTMADIRDDMLVFCDSDTVHIWKDNEPYASYKCNAQCVRILADKRIRVGANDHGIILGHDDNEMFSNADVGAISSLLYASGNSVYTLKDNKLIYTLPDQHDRITAVSGDKKHFCYGTEEGRVGTVRLHKKQPPKHTPGRVTAYNQILGIRFFKDGYLWSDGKFTGGIYDGITDSQGVFHGTNGIPIIYTTDGINYLN